MPTKFSLRIDAYEYGNDLRASSGSVAWDDSLESRARDDWENVKAKSSLTWDKAKDAVRDAFDRTHRTYRAYNATDRYYADTYAGTDYHKSDYDYDQDYKPAYRYGTQARINSVGNAWDASESDLERGWERAKGTSRLAWNDARHAVRDAWHGVERALPGDADRDGR